MKHTAILLLLLLLAAAGAKAQNAYYDAKFIANYDTSAFPLLTVEKRGTDNVVEDSLFYRLSVRKPGPDINARDTVQKGIHIGFDENERKALANFVLFYRNPFATNLQIIDMAAVRSGLKKLAAASQRAEGELVAGGTKLVGRSSKAGPLAAGAIFSAVMGVIPQLGGGGNKGLSVSKEQQSVIIDGITRYYAAEFKKAQTLSYMRFITKMMEQYPDLPIFFPETMEKLKNTDPARFPELGDEYKDIFSKDLKAMLKNVTAYVDEYDKVLNKKLKADATENERIAYMNRLDKYKGYQLLNTQNMDKILASDYYLSIRITTDIGDKMLNRYPVADLFAYLDNTYGTSTANDNNIDKSLRYTIKGINIIQYNLRDTTEGKTWVSLNELQAMKPNEVKYFAGLMYQNYKDDIHVLGSTEQEHIENIYEMATTLSQAVVEIQELRNAFKDKAEQQDYEKLFAATMELIVKYSDYAGGKSLKIKAYAQQAKYMGYMYSNLQKGNYANVSYYSLQIIKDMIKINDTTLLPGSFEVMDKVAQFGSFMTETINAKNSEDVKDVIKKYAAPPASYQLKRERVFTVSLTGQPGYFFGREYLDGDNGNFKYTHGLTLPMGAEFTFKLRPNKPDNFGKQNLKDRTRGNSSSLGVFLHIVDLGTPLSYRLADDTSKGLPKDITIDDILAPGISINYGFRNSPITIGATAQRIAPLRSFDADNDGNYLLTPGVRYCVRLAWDIPFVNIYKTEKR